MKYQSTDTEMFLKAREYVDTVIIPLNPITYGESFVQAVSSADFLAVLTFELEKELKGRLLLAPAIPYMKEDSLESKTDLIKKWMKYYHSQGFVHIYFITTDITLNSLQLPEVIWLPAIPIEKMPADAARPVIEDQTRQLIDMLTQRWQQPVETKG